MISKDLYVKKNITKLNDDYSEIVYELIYKDNVIATGAKVKKFEPDLSEFGFPQSGWTEEGIDAHCIARLLSDIKVVASENK